MNEDITGITHEISCSSRVHRRELTLILRLLSIFLQFNLLD